MRNLTATMSGWWLVLFAEQNLFFLEVALIVISYSRDFWLGAATMLLALLSLGSTAYYLYYWLQTHGRRQRA